VLEIFYEPVEVLKSFLVQVSPGVAADTDLIAGHDMSAEAC